MRLKLTIQYDGTEYSGWQVQPDVPTIQGALEAAIASIEGHRAPVFAAGRTDAGVHALGQVAHVDVEKALAPAVWARALNAQLALDVRVVRAEEAPADFHARRGARGKLYEYRAWTGPVMSPFVRRYVTHAPGLYDLAAMREAAALLVGHHDFEAFTVADRDAKTTERDLRRLVVEAEGDLLTISAEADGFLRAMARTLAGTLLEIGRARMPVEAAGRALVARRRGLAGPTAPAAGLTLVRVDY
jgi:tRNA pseudouridine38-40 synthase